MIHEFEKVLYPSTACDVDVVSLSICHHHVAAPPYLQMYDTLGHRQVDIQQFHSIG
jgi:hypothetical protein